ncbi:MAG TPA: GNAT family N-acetyltransferase [Candidatus Saccharimonadales bacterium]|nr:GNAT family N-acetyltransferase [Candidatus Saccharimonadales bacterium]
MKNTITKIIFLSSLVASSGQSLSNEPENPHLFSNYEFKSSSIPDPDGFSEHIQCKTKDTNDDCGILKYGFEYCHNALTTNFERQIYIAQIYVPEKYRRQGIATRMLQEVEKHCKDQENSARLTLTSSNKGATACYLKFGFQKDNPYCSDHYCRMHKDISNQE